MPAHQSHAAQSAQVQALRWACRFKAAPRVALDEALGRRQSSESRQPLPSTEMRGEREVVQEPAEDGASGGSRLAVQLLRQLTEESFGNVSDVPGAPRDSTWTEKPGRQPSDLTEYTQNTTRHVF